VTLTTFRDTLRNSLPRWLQGDNAVTRAGRLVYAFGVHLDAVADALVGGVKSRFPGVYSTETIPVIGRERRIIRGPFEGDDQYAARLRGAFDAHRRAGNPFALLEQLRAHLAPETPGVLVSVVNRNGTVYARDSSGAPSVTGGTWDWDATPELWSRFWVVLRATKWTDEGINSAPGVFGEAGTMGSTATVEEVAAVRSIVSQWTPPHAQCVNVIVVLDGAAWDADQPDGDWDLWGNRNPAAVYWDGT
jgi:hypothetical protein